ncbi:P-loop containing nucleoside triphosphate hydrolase protein [Massariosphaeria phaeospora]|uniref:ATP-dependent DNA helicase n=1 Tax=Massariosphaeria phaeospora TaxID=100035 RepID=A0A7C8MGY4_9PLEO|nr:P-loop containing nucleoside triphosphate hydrolase protein [Massariosphaeria phaeospora]
MSSDYDLASEDEADLIAATTPSVDKKRKLDDIETGNDLTVKKVNTGPSPSIPLANRVLRERFGLPSFRLKQEAAIARILDGESATVVFPTGAGKSICYQVPAVAFRIQDQETGSRAPEFSGVTLVISPLIALMKDQVDALLKRKINAAVLNSSVSRDHYLATQEDLRLGRLDMLYCAPERLNSEGFIASLKAIPGGIRLLAVDEAHCISEWGHSFRPDYLKIARFAQEAKVERVVCLTATATPKVAQDICKAFNIPSEGLFTTTVYRPNLRLLAQTSTTHTDDVGRLASFLTKHPGPTIIYVTIQKGAEMLAGELVARGFQARPYHAGMNTDVRTKTQDNFLASGKMIVVATIAFGMGIDKPNIRNVVHFDIPSSIESYSQQIGRAGRDGLPSTCLFNLSTKDFYLRNIFTYGDRPSDRSLRLLFKDICSPERQNLKAGDIFEVSLYHQSRDVDIGPTTLGILYAHLELHYKLFRSAGALYTDYKYKPQNSRLISSDESPSARAIVRASVTKGKWTQVSLDDVATSTGIARMDLVRKMDEWNERGAIELEKRGVLNTYRLEKPLPSDQEEIDIMIKELDAGMAEKERQDLERTTALIDLVTDKKCFSRSLAEYFGESGVDMPNECGHCTWCETHEQVVLPDEPPQPPDPEKIKRILSVVKVRDDPRLLAKIAFGIKSPRIGAMKIYNTGVFESMNVCDFMELVRIFTEECAREGGGSHGDG